MTEDARTELLSFVAIGRNEGERLKSCLRSLREQSSNIVYVDSGSTDGSIDFAESLGVEVVSLDMSIPFTAARARNAGFDAVKKTFPASEFVMFIDGDCELAPGFATAALEFLYTERDIGIVTGRCREARRDATIYNRLCDFEWDGPIGDIPACGGIFMTRCAVFQAAGGFDPNVIAAEDDEFCIRVRQQGFRVHRIAAEMCRHDADMRRFGQWWTRSVRAGYAFAQVGAMHEGYFRAERIRSWSWGLILPAAAILLAPVTFGASLLLFALYGASFWRTRRGLLGRGFTAADAGLYASFLTISKFPNVTGMINFWRKKLTGKELKIIEYK